MLLVLSETDLEKKIKGTLRKGCPGFGHARQPERRVNSTLKLARLREVMRHSTILKELPIDAYIVTSTDEHQVFICILHLEIILMLKNCRTAKSKCTKNDGNISQVSAVAMGTSS